MSWKKSHPPEQGWMKMVMTLRKADTLTEEQIKALATHGEADQYEFGSFGQSGKTVTVVMREKKERSA